jgi:hypothetical protein
MIVHDAVVGPMTTVRILYFVSGAKGISATHAHLKCLTHAKRAMSAKYASQAGTSSVPYTFGAANTSPTTSTD